jgi:predicted RNase H-like nuclease (RuvC/YqgF family)
VNKTEAIALLKSEGWTEADARRALDRIDFQNGIDELTMRRRVSSFAGEELLSRQRLQAAQKGMVTKRNKEIASYKQETDQLTSELTKLVNKNKELASANEELKKDNKALKNLVDQIRLRITVDVNQLMRLEDSEIRQGLARWFKKSEG